MHKFVIVFVLFAGLTSVMSLEKLEVEHYLKDIKNVHTKLETAVDNFAARGFHTFQNATKFYLDFFIKQNYSETLKSFPVNATIETNYKLEQILNSLKFYEIYSGLISSPLNITNVVKMDALLLVGYYKETNSSLEKSNDIKNKLVEIINKEATLKILFNKADEGLEKLYNELWKMNPYLFANHPLIIQTWLKSTKTYLKKLPENDINKKMLSNLNVLIDFTENILSNQPINSAEKINNILGLTHGYFESFKTFQISLQSQYIQCNLLRCFDSHKFRPFMF